VVVRDGGPVERTSWRAGMRLHEALERTGAPGDHQVWLLRPRDGRFILCDYWNYFATADPRHDPMLEADDIVFLQRRDDAVERRDADLFMMLNLMEGTLTPEDFAEARTVTKDPP
jgi:hypothetical protein